MRTTLDIDDGVLRWAKAMAAERGTSIGAAVSELARRGMRSTIPDDADDFPVFVVPDDAGPLTPDLVREANEDW